MERRERKLKGIQSISACSTIASDAINARNTLEYSEGKFPYSRDPFSRVTNSEGKNNNKFDFYLFIYLGNGVE